MTTLKSRMAATLIGVMAMATVIMISQPAYAANVQVTISSGASNTKGTCTTTDCFNPQVVNINVGDTVTWTNQDTVGHTATSGKPTDNQTGTVFDSSLISAGKSYTSPAFNTPGTYNYFCQVHPWMTGEVIVGSGGGAGTPPAPNISNAAGASANMPLTFVAHLAAAPGVNTQATGEATFQLSPDGQSLSYNLTVSNIQNAFMAHIHLSPSGDIGVWLYPDPNNVATGGEQSCVSVLSGGSPSSCPGYKAGTFSGMLAQGTITAADLGGSACVGCAGLAPATMSTLVSDIKAGSAYVNVHTTQNPPGEIQGTISASASPSQSPVPEFPLSVPVLLIGMTLLLFYYKIFNRRMKNSLTMNF